jgi:hypothetical protein
MRDQEILGLSESYNQVIANEVELNEKSGSPRPTFMPRSRERDIGKHDDWKDQPPEEWDDKTSEQKKAGKLSRRARAVVQTQRRQDRETNVSEEVLSYLLGEGFASDEKSAEAIMDAMSEAWVDSIVEEFKDLTPEKENRVRNRVGELARDIQVSGARMNDLNKKPFSKFRPKVKAEKKSILKSARKKHKHVANASDALVRTSISREAGIVKKMHDLRKKLEELDEN